MNHSVLFVATVVKTHIMQFHLPYLEMFQNMGWYTAVAAKNDYACPEDCKIPHCNQFFNIPFARNPFKPINLKALWQLKKIIDSGEYSIIHCHTPVGAMLTRIAAIGARKRGTKVVYTAHGFHFFKGAPLKNWLLYYPVERLLARFTDVLITINREDYTLAQSFQAKKVCYVPGVGIDTGKFSSDPTCYHEKRKELGLKDDDFLLLSVGELIRRKNHEIVLRAVASLKNDQEYSRLHYLICGRGELDTHLKELSLQLGISDHVHFLGYRNDVSQICNSSDLFVFMSCQEGLPVALMEAMGCGIPSICSEIRGNTDLIESGKEGLIVGNSAESVAAAITDLMDDPERCRAYGTAAQQKVKQFDIKQVRQQMQEIYAAACDSITDMCGETL